MEEFKHIDEIKPQVLQFVIAGYGDKLVYHEYDSDKSNLNAGKPLTTETLRSVIKVVSDKFIDFETTYNFSGIIPRNALRFLTDEKKIIWWTPAQKRRLLFSKGKIKTSIYPVPVLLWKLESNELKVWALKSQPKSMSDRLYHAPFFNVNSQGLICMGNAKFTSDTMDYAEVMKVAETAFFNSYFTHSSHNNLINGNFTEFMIEQLKTKVESFPIKKLVPTNKTIKSILGYNDSTN